MTQLLDRASTSASTTRPSTILTAITWAAVSCKPNDQPIIPLTDDRAVLDASIDGMQASGTTAGHIGTQFGWFMLSPKWNSLWPADSQAGPYGDNGLLKVAIIMTDGEYNTWYSDGQGNSFEQARDICDAMKTEGIEVYTIGFDMQEGSSTDALKYCATSSDHYFAPYDGQALRDVFRDIGSRIAMAADGIRLAN